MKIGRHFLKLSKNKTKKIINFFLSTGENPVKTKHDQSRKFNRK